VGSEVAVPAAEEPPLRDNPTFCPLPLVICGSLSEGTAIIYLQKLTLNDEEHPNATMAIPACFFDQEQQTA
jgi:hypothetical protein